MKIGFLKETTDDEKRLSLTPSDAQKLSELGASVLIEEGFEKNLFKKGDFKGAQSINRNTLLKESDIIITLHPPEKKTVSKLKKGAIHISFLDPLNSKTILDAANKQEITLISLEMIPRTTRAQKMDVLSSQASLAGYVAVLEGATRPVVEEQVQSLGAKFIKVDLGDMGQTKDGYAKQLTDKQLEKQREVMATHCKMADLVITTAQVFGKKAPVIVKKEVIEEMQKGSVIVDLAVESGGNVEGSECSKDIQISGVTIVGISNIAGQVALHASQMLSANITHLLTEFWNKETKIFELNLEDEILEGCVITHKGQLVNERIKAQYG